MAYYTLFNKQSQKQLTHPAIGLWFTPNLEEAQEMLVSCHEYLTIMGIPIHEDVVIVDAETGVEI